MPHLSPETVTACEHDRLLQVTEHHLRDHMMVPLAPLGTGFPWESSSASMWATSIPQRRARSRSTLIRATMNSNASFDTSRTNAAGLSVNEASTQR